MTSFRIKIALGFASVLAAAALVATTPAAAGTYDVVACDAAGGANGSWLAAVTDNRVTAGQVCPSGGNERYGLVARNVVAPGNGDAPSGAVAQWAFWAPPGTSIVGLYAAYHFYRSWPTWEAALSDGHTVIRGCPASSASIECEASSSGEWIPLSGQSVIYIDALCTATTCPTNSTNDPAHDYVMATANLYSATVRLEDDSPPSIGTPAGSLWSGRWLSGTQTYAFSSSDNAGVRRTRVLVDGALASEAVKACDFAQRVPCASGDTSGSIDTGTVRQDGMHTVTIQSIDPAGNVAQVAKQVAIDNTAPSAPTHVELDGGDAWRNANAFTVQWRDPAQPGTAPIVGAAYALCPVAGPPSACHQGSASGQNIASLSKLTVPATGDWKLSVWLRDAAGNADASTASDPVHLRLDDQAPSSAVFAAPDQSDPTKLAVDASDVGSGITGGAIEYKKHRGTAWHGLPSQVVGSALVAHVKDENLVNGVYDVRARVNDAAGNERATSTNAAGAPETITLPLRLPTHMVAGRDSHHGRHHRYSTHLHLRFRRRAGLGGYLTNGTGAPFVDTPIAVFQRVHVPGAAWTPVALLQTSKTGTFRYVAPAGLSRTLRFRYLGTPTIRSSHRDVVLRVAAASTFHVSRHFVVNGETVRIHGRLRGGHFPRGGKLVAIQVFLRGAWHTFATTRSHAHGKWHYDYRFNGTRGHQIYRFRAMLPHEATYPFATGVSPTARVLVRGL